MSLTNYLFGSAKADMQCNCLVGEPYIENGVCKCTQPPVTQNQQPNPFIVGNQHQTFYKDLQQLNNSLMDRINQLLSGGQQQTGTPASDNKIVEFAKANPLISLAVVGGAAYFLFFKGGSFKSRESVTTTKW